MTTDSKTVDSLRLSWIWTFRVSMTSFMRRFLASFSRLHCLSLLAQDFLSSASSSLSNSLSCCFCSCSCCARYCLYLFCSSRSSIYTTQPQLCWVWYSLISIILYILLLWFTTTTQRWNYSLICIVLVYFICYKKKIMEYKNTQVQELVN